MLTLFDLLATEIILDIFEYLSCNDIIYSFFYFNQRLNLIVLQYQRYLNKFETPIKNFDFWKNILPIIGTNIHQLVITTTNFSYSLNLFPNLKSIIISSSIPIDSDQLNFLLENKRFSSLISFKIQSKISYKDNLDYFKKIISNGYSLETFECISILDRILDNSIIFTNIHSLSLKSYKLITGVSLIKSTPKLKTFNLILANSEISDEFCEPIDLSSIKLENISLTFQLEDNGYGGQSQIMYGSDFILLMKFIKQFSSSLIYLSLNLSCLKFRDIDMKFFNINQFQQKYIEPMIQLKKVHFVAHLSVYLNDILSVLKNKISLI